MLSSAFVLTDLLFIYVQFYNFPQILKMSVNYYTVDYTTSTALDKILL